MLLHEGANLAVREALGRRIDGQDESRIRSLFIFREDDEFARHDLFPVVVPHGAGHQQQLALLDLALEKRTAGPGALQQTALVLQDGTEYAQPAPSRENASAHDAPDARDLLSDVRAGQGRHGRRVEIAMRDVIEEIARRTNAKSLEGLGALGTDAFQEFDRRIELQPHSATRRWAKRSGSNSSSSSSSSPVPRNRIGAGTARRNATTLPPFAVLSSFVITRPVSGTASANSRACWTAFWPIVASRTSRDSCGAPGWRFPTTRTTLRSSSRKRSSVCSRPAVSTSTVSIPRARPATTASNATAAGSAPLPEFAPTKGTRRRWAHVSSCSVAPARKVSAAASSTLRPSLLNRCASFATVVVLPVPFTPKTSTTVGGFCARASGVAGGPSCSTTMRSRACSLTSPPPRFSRISSV